MSRYNSIEEINRDLKKLKLQQAIASEELKNVQYQLKKDLRPMRLLLDAFSSVKKYGILFLIKKLIR